MNIENEELIIDFGALNYPISKMASILEKEESIISSNMNDPSSRFYKLFQKGKDMADFVIDKKIFDLAKSGDHKAIEKYENRKRLREEAAKRAAEKKD